MHVVISVWPQEQARRKVFAIGAANSGEGNVGKGVNFTIITCTDPVPGKNYCISDIGRYVLGSF